MSDSSKVRCAVVGLGMGRFHASWLSEYDEAELVGLVDISDEKLAEFGKLYPDAQCFKDYKEMVNKVKPDVVCIALPNSLHCPVSVDLLKAGCNVLCEKPMAMTVAEAEKMRDAAAETGKVLGINFSQRFSAEHRKCREIVDSGALGQIYQGYTSWTRRDWIPGFGGWFGQKALSGGGPLIDLGVHRIDLALWLMGHPEVLTVSGMAHKHIGIPRAAKQSLKFDVEDFATGFVRLSNGASLLFEVSWVGHQQHNETLDMRIIGVEGALEKNHNGLFLHTVAHNIGVSGEVRTGWGKPLTGVQEFARCIKYNEPFIGTPEHGIHVQQILNGLYESAEKGHEITVKH